MSTVGLSFNSTLQGDKCKYKGWSYPWTLTEHHANKAYWGSGRITPRILDLDTWRRCGQLHVPAPGTHWIGGWIGPRAGLDAVVKTGIPSPCRDSNSRSSSPLTRLQGDRNINWLTAVTSWKFITVIRKSRHFVRYLVQYTFTDFISVLMRH